MSSCGACIRKDRVVIPTNAGFRLCAAIFVHAAWCAYLFVRRYWQLQRVVARIWDTRLRRGDPMPIPDVRPNRPEAVASLLTALWRHVAPEYGIHCYKRQITSFELAGRPGWHHFRYLDASSQRRVGHEEVLACGAQGVAMRSSHRHHGQSPDVRRDQAHATPPAETLRPAKSNNRAMPR